MRKIIGSIIIILWVLGYVAVAAAIGDTLKNAAWWIKLIYFPVAGLLWIVPVGLMFKWMHAKDGPVESPDV